MAATKRIIVTVPEPLLQLVDGIAAMEQTDRNALIREAVRIYVEERKKRDMRERMKHGYRDMAGINLTLAEEGPIFEKIGELT